MYNILDIVPLCISAKAGHWNKGIWEA